MHTMLEILLACLMVLFSAQSALAADPSPQNGQRLRVGVKIIEPFVIDMKSHYSGFSVDMWQQIADRLHWQYDFVAEPSASDEIQAVENGKLDLAVSAVSMTGKREKLVDFSHPYYDCGLQILVRPHHPHSLIELLDPQNLPLLQILEIAAVIGFIQTHIIYLTERGSNPKFQQGYLHGLWEGFWWMCMIIATGEYGEKDTPHPFKRLVTITFYLLGVIFIAAFTATVTSNLTLHDLAGDIKGPHDLPGKRVVTVADCSAARFLSNHGIKFNTVAKIEDAYPLLISDKVDAVVYDSPVLQYYASNEGKGVTMVVGPVFAHVPIGIVLPIGSPMRKPIDTLILQFYQDGTYDEINQKWFKSDN